MTRWRGFTLWELLCALAVAAAALVWGAPGLQALVLDTRRSADVNAFVAAIQLARSEAIKRGKPVVLCKTADRLQCGGHDVRFDMGWMVFVDEDGARPPQPSPGEPLLLAHQPRLAGTVTANRALFEFRPFPLRSTNGTVTFCDRRGPAAARAVIISYTGRPRTTAEAAGGEALTCSEVGP